MIKHDGGKAIIGKILDELNNLLWPIVNQQGIWRKRAIHKTIMWDSFGNEKDDIGVVALRKVVHKIWS